MADSAVNRVSDVDSNAVFAALDKIVAETPFAEAERKGDLFTDIDDAPKAAVSIEPEVHRDVAATKPALRFAVAPKAERVRESESAEDPFVAPAVPEYQPSPVVPDTAEKRTVRTLLQATRDQAAVAALIIIVVSEFAFIASLWGMARRNIGMPSSGIVTVESTPAGATIAINGQSRGRTPLTLTLAPGRYAMAITSGDVTRNIPVIVRAGSSDRIYLSESKSSQSSGHPSTVPDKAALSLRRDVSSLKPVAPVPTAAALPPTGTVGGWLSVTAPVDLQLFEGGVLIGSTQTDRIVLPVGRHVIDAVNTAVGYKTSSTVQVSAGSVTRFKPEMPNGTLNINAIPWAEVTIDGKHLGATPLGNVSLPIGPHDVVFTHPQLGERRQSVIVTLSGLNRVSVNLNQR